MARIFIIGGTKEARKVAESLHANGHCVMSSLAGVTESPRLPVGAVRVGGYGNDQAMLDFIHRWGAEVLIDCAHPFAVRIKSRLGWVAEKLQLPLWAYRRENWVAGSDDNWHFVSDLQDGMAVASGLGQRVFAALGRQQFQALAKWECEFLLLRQVPSAVDALGMDFKAEVEVISAYPPDSVEEETALLQSRKIEVVLCKESGGSTGSAKLAAARALALPVVIIKQPNVEYPKSVKFFGKAKELSF